MNHNIKKKLREWVKLDEEIHILQKKLNKIKKRKVYLSPDIIEFMTTNKKDKININSNYKLELKSKIQYTNISKKYINDVLKKVVDDSIVDQIIDVIYNNRKKKQINNLEINKI